MRRKYNLCKINNMSFYEIINELFLFKDLYEGANPFNINRIIIGDLNKRFWEDNHSLKLDVIYNKSLNSPNSNTITLSSVKTGEILLTIQQTPTTFPDTDRKWSYEISYCSFDFNPSFRIRHGYACMMGER